MGSGRLTPGHVLIVLLVVLLLFGTRRLPELGRSLGSGMREFKDSVSGDASEPEIPSRPAAEKSEAS
jgi:sec-independent protein translocase protein TatA